MKIGIFTQPLTTNYGGILQNYALQTILKSWGHDVVTFDIYRFNWFDWLNINARTLIHRLVGHSYRHFTKTPASIKNTQMPLRSFVQKHISLSQPRTPWFEKKRITKYNPDAIIVGSDQVWRPAYNPHIEDMFLCQTKGMNIERIAFAASFGTDTWEYSERQTIECSILAKEFNAISVREDSAVKLCAEHLGVTATQVLDPTLLLPTGKYIELCNDIPTRKPFVYAYILDNNTEKINSIKMFAEDKGLDYVIKSAGSEICKGDSIELWLSYFRDATYVITDSFHGTVFSIIFNKDFYVFSNENRGNSRFDSLLGKLHLTERMIQKDIPNSDDRIDWTQINSLKEAEAKRSTNWLKQALING